jgi:hypothetical protein
MGNSELTWILLAIAFTVTLSGLLIARRRPIPLRPISAYAILPTLTASALESDTRTHFSIGGSAIGETGTISALASAEIIYRVASRLAVGEQLPLITLSDPTTLPLAQDTLRRAYEFRQRLDRYHSTTAAWFPQGQRSVAYAAGASSLAADADVTHSILLGRYGIEMAIFGESALRHDQHLIAHSDAVEGQAVAFAQADELLIGEELYAGLGYLAGRPFEIGSLVAMDILRWLVILGILVAALQAAV